ncbi:MAG: LysM domain-containing protein [Kiritimatiellia bacterium]
MRVMNFRLTALGCLLAAGCFFPLFWGSTFGQQVTERNQNALAQRKTSSEMTSMEGQRLSEQINTLSHNQQLIDSRLRSIELQLGSIAQAPQQAIALLRNELELLRVDRERLRAQITDDLADKIEKVAAKQQQALQATQTQAPAAATSASAAARNSGYEHKVERGQTLSEIARGYNTTVEKIIKANNIKNPSTIWVGQTLFIPD